jgi:parallel beta-helix repeat protein
MLGYLQIESALRDQVRQEAVDDLLATGRQLLSDDKYFEAEKAFSGALQLWPNYEPARKGVHKTRLTRVLASVQGFIDEEDWKGADRMLVEAESLALADPKVQRLRRLQIGTSTLAIGSDTAGLTAYWARPVKGVLWTTPDIVPAPSAAVIAGILEPLGELPYGPVDRPFGSGWVILARGDTVVEVRYVSIPRSTEVSFHRSTVRVGPKGRFRTLGEALDAVKAGTVIEVAPGEYVENLSITQPYVTLRATGGRVVLRGSGKGAAITVQKAPGFRLSGFDVHAGKGPLLLIEASPGSTVSACRFEGGTGKDQQGTIRLVDSSCSLVSDCSIQKTQGWGLEFSGSNNCAAVNNDIRDNNGGVGVYVHHGSALVARNRLLDNGGACVYIHESSNSPVVENVCSNSLFGIFVNGTSNSVDIRGNLVTGCTTDDPNKTGRGIFINPSTNLTNGVLRHNTVWDCGIGIHIIMCKVGCIDSIIAGNTRVGIWLHDAGHLDYLCLWNNNILGQWVSISLYSLKELQDIEPWRPERMRHGQEVDPLFSDVKAEDFSLGQSSPCRGAASNGTNLGVKWSVIDAVRRGEFKAAAWWSSHIADIYASAATSIASRRATPKLEDAEKALTMLARALLLSPNHPRYMQKQHEWKALLTRDE